MAHVFDPAKLRANHPSRFEQARKLALEEKFNSFFWAGAVGEVALAYFVDAASNPDWHVRELLDMARRELRRGLQWPKEPTSGDALYNTAYGLAALAIADWIATGALQPETMTKAHDAYLRYFEQVYEKKNPTNQSIMAALELACAAERFQEGTQFIAAHLPQKQLDPTKARTSAELCLALNGTPPSEPLARRYLRAHLPKQLAHGQYSEGALSFYVATVAGLPGPVADALRGAPTFISYLKEAKSKKGLSDVPVNPTPAPNRPAPRLARILPSSAAPAPGSRALWKQTGEGWALYTPHIPSHQEFRQQVDERSEDIVEWSADTLHLSDLPGGLARLKRLRRATPDGRTLAAWSRSDQELPLEVAFAPSTSNWNEGRRVPMPPKLDKTVWKDTLDVGALTHLRAISIDAIESEKDRLKRGDGPYPIVPAWFVSSRLAGCLEALEVHASPHDLATSLELFDVLPHLRELIVWFRAYGLHTACFWCERGKGVLIQAQGIAVDEPVLRASADRRTWDKWLPQILTPAAAERLARADVTTILEKNVDPEEVRKAVGRYINVESVTLGGALREL